MMQISIAEGTAAPDFTFAGAEEASCCLSGLRGRRVLLAFFRFSACAMCNLRIRHFIRRYGEWSRQGMEVLAVFESPESNVFRYVGRQDPPFPIIADPDGELYNLFGVEVSVEKVSATMKDADTPKFITEAAAEGFSLTPEEGSNFHRIPAEFLIDENGIVRVAHYGRLVTDHLPLHMIDRFAAGGASGAADA